MLVRSTAALALIALSLSCGGAGQVRKPSAAIAAAPDATVGAIAETEPVLSDGDAADDSAIWVDPAEPARSLIIATDKKRGLEVYDLQGRRIYRTDSGKCNNVDIRQGFPLGGRLVDIVATENRTNNSIGVYRVDGKRPQLIDIAAAPIQSAQDVYGSCLHRSKSSGKLYAFVGSKEGAVEQWELMDNGEGKIVAEKRRVIKFDSTVEGMVADDDRSLLYVSEEARGIWRLDADPRVPAQPALISEIGPGKPLARPEVEGLAIYDTGEGNGWLIASSQGSNEYVLFDRTGDNTHVGTFRIGAAGAIDGTEETDGISVTSLPLGPGLDRGMFVAQDGANEGGFQNFKIVAWSEIERQLGLAGGIASRQ